MANFEEAWIHDVRNTLNRSDTNFFRVRAARYWADFVLSVVLAYSSASVFLLATRGSWQQLLAFPVAVFWLYRLGSLVHEVCHLSQHELRSFKVAWNLIVGVMTLAPSPFFTRHHRDHHSQRLYGTPQDPEYIVNQFRPGSWLSFLAYSLLVAVFPLIVFLRFFLAPLTYLHPRLRAWTLKHASALTMNWRYERKLTPEDHWAIVAVEWACWLRATAIPAGVLFGWSHWTRMPLFYSLALGVLVINQLRLLADHHFESDGNLLPYDSHIRDSCNYTGRDPLTCLLFPFSIRFHALHHLFPSLPYHNLAAAHAHLLDKLPADSPYRTLDQGSWWSVARQTLGGHAAGWKQPAKAAAA
jgi:fatty acid desaturase